MDSREAGIGFVLGALAGAGAVVLWRSRTEALAVLGSVQRTGEIVEARIRKLDQFAGDVTSVAGNTARRFDEVTDVAGRNLIGSILELATVLGELRWHLTHLFPKRAA